MGEVPQKESLGILRLFRRLEPPSGRRILPSYCPSTPLLGQRISIHGGEEGQVYKRREEDTRLRRAIISATVGVGSGDSSDPPTKTTFIGRISTGSRRVGAPRAGQPPGSRRASAIGSSSSTRGGSCRRRSPRTARTVGATASGPRPPNKSREEWIAAPVPDYGIIRGLAPEARPDPL